MKKQQNLLRISIVIICGLLIFSGILTILRIEEIPSRYLGILNLVLLIILAFLDTKLRKRTQKYF
ncbi:hypothetical protein T190115A13A_150097 [Tenacibaculum sp. 190524A02b]|uniref:Uncharacterized protein n=1 Tax=Tenacibaculum vairaonense TaxID=3137860 RepID=A0ABP1F6W4_9FLAO